MFIPLKSSPEGARVLLDGKQKGYTPMTLQFFYLHDSRGSHSDETRQRTLKIEKEGHEPYILPFSITGKEYEKIPDSIPLKRFEEEVQTVDAPEKDQPTIQEVTEEKEQDKEAVKEIGKPEVSLLLPKEEDIGVKQDGLVHISQLANRYVKSPFEVVSVGDVVRVKVMNVDAERGRIGLSIKEAQ